MHTRISEELSEDIRRIADDLRVPVSNLVRNVLEETFSVVETVTDNVGEILEDVLEEASDARERIRARGRHRRRSHGSRGRYARGRRRERASDDDIERELRSDEQAETGKRDERKEFPDVLGWQPVVLNRERVCADCGVHLPKGERAFLGLSESGPSQTTLCRECTRET